MDEDVSPNQTVFPVPLAVFAKGLKGTPDEIWSRLLKIRHGSEKHTPVEWQRLIERARNEPAHPTVVRR